MMMMFGRIDDACDWLPYDFPTWPISSALRQTQNIYLQFCNLSPGHHELKIGSAHKGLRGGSRLATKIFQIMLLNEAETSTELN